MNGLVEFCIAKLYSLRIFGCVYDVVHWLSVLTQDMDYIVLWLVAIGYDVEFFFEYAKLNH